MRTTEQDILSMEGELDLYQSTAILSELGGISLCDPVRVKCQVCGRMIPRGNLNLCQDCAVEALRRIAFIPHIRA